jgi:hypothetical protein
VAAMATKIGLKDKAHSAQVRERLQKKAARAAQTLRHEASSVSSQARVKVPELTRTARGRFQTSKGFGTAATLGAVGTRAIYAGRTKSGMGIMLAGLLAAVMALRRRRRRLA